MEITMSKKKKILISFLTLILVVVGGILGYAANYLVTYAFDNPHRTEKQLKSKGQERIDQEWLSKQKDGSQWDMRAQDTKQKLVAFYYPAKKATKKTIVVAHGYQGSHYTMASYIRMFHEKGYNVLAPDDRGSGQSQGRYVTFGYPDSRDYLIWVQRVIAKNGRDSQIGLFGVSMGGATVMMMSGLKLPHQVKAIVEDCGYDTVANELTYQLKQQFNMPKEPLITLSLLIARFRVGHNFTEASSVNALHKNRLPVLFIHGQKDTFVPTKMVYNNFKATEGEKYLWITPNTKHADSLKNYPHKYRQKVGQFYDKFWQ